MNTACSETRGAVWAKGPTLSRSAPTTHTEGTARISEGPRTQHLKDVREAANMTPSERPRGREHNTSRTSKRPQTWHLQNVRGAANTTPPGCPRGREHDIYRTSEGPRTWHLQDVRGAANMTLLGHLRGCYHDTFRMSEGPWTHHHHHVWRVNMTPWSVCGSAASQWDLGRDSSRDCECDYV